MKSPRNIKPNDVRPFTPTEVAAIIKACGLIGQTAYERLRTLAMILTLRYTALRIGDVAMLARDRISRDGDRWRASSLRNGKERPACVLARHLPT